MKKLTSRKSLTERAVSAEFSESRTFAVSAVIWGDKAYHS